MQMEKLSMTSILLHWIVAVMMVMLLGSGIYMHEFEARDVYPIHKSMGITITLFVVIRILWRIKEGWPQPHENHAPWERILSRISHYVLITGTLLMPISGMIGSVAGGRGLYWFGVELIARDPTSKNKMLAEAAHNAHHTIATIIILFLILHIAGALKHHFIDKDNTLRRIFGG